MDKEMAMRVFIAGGTGVVGRRLVPQLLARGYQVTATTTSPAKLGVLERLGAEAVVMNGLDAVSVGAAVARARPERITCWPPPRRPAFPSSSRRATPAGTESARGAG